ncbi:MAG TPA: sigma-70 family RNA polymerase sigma factor [Candidatus Hydrogenedentes bacterium]|nr:sigma-70 family RNA polymerase sigma factor [Candidatus Hydrogenedentota bacterium]HPG66668.1 sigma-70 family RNA polymerase sigma factor [Candidatus Hydrogenedentota bacterium]
MAFEDEQLVLRSVEGDAEAFGKLVERYQDAVYATAYYYAGRYGAAEDIAQETFLNAYRALPRLKERDRFGPWLKAIACRTAANWLRRHLKKIRNETPLPFRRTVSIEDAREGPRGRLERSERYERVQMAIDSLPERCRLPVVLRYLQELSYREISGFTGESEEEIRGILYRAGRQLRDVLADLNESEGESRWHRVRR